MPFTNCKAGDIIFFSENGKEEVALFTGKDQRTDAWSGFCFHEEKLIEKPLTGEIHIDAVYRHQNDALASKAVAQMNKWQLCNPRYSKIREDQAQQKTDITADNLARLAVYTALKFTARRDGTPARQAVDKPPKGFFTSGFIILCYQAAAMMDHVTAAAKENWPSDKHGVDSADKINEGFQVYLRLLNHSPIDGKTSLQFWKPPETNPIEWARNPENQFPLLYWKKTTVPDLQAYFSQSSQWGRVAIKAQAAALSMT